MVQPFTGLDIQAIRYSILAEFPYFRELLFKLQPIAMNLPGAYMAVDKSCRWYIDVEKIKTKPLVELCAMTLHEMFHILDNHFVRGENLTVIGADGIPLWGRGTDKAINCKFGGTDGIKKFKLPDDCLHPTKEHQPVNLMAEEYYALDLEKEEQKEKERKNNPPPPQPPKGPKENKKPGDGPSEPGEPVQGKPGNGKSDGKPQPGKPGDSKSNPPQQGKDPGKDQPSDDEGGSDGEDSGPATGQGKCGSCSGPGHFPWEINNGEPDPSDPETPGITKIEVDRTIKQVAEDIKEASKIPGKVPGNLARWAEEQLKSKVNWHNELKHGIISVVQIAKGKLDYSYSKRSRRQGAYEDIILPGFIGTQIHVVIIMDTSASMRTSYIEQGKAEVLTILKHLECEVTLISCDAVVHSSTVIKSKKDVKFEGGGGTDLSVGYRFAETLKPRVNIVIFITDCETPWPKTPIKGTKNLIVNVNENLYQHYKDRLPTWCKTFHINEAK